VSLNRGLLVIVEIANLGLVATESGLDRVVAVLHDEVDKRFERSVAGVVDKVSAASGLELEGRETCGSSARRGELSFFRDLRKARSGSPAISKGALGGTSFSVASILALQEELRVRVCSRGHPHQRHSHGQGVSELLKVLGEGLPDRSQSL
jgi:hypothetical protein